ncbi:hypothetical protein B0H11DRAFT_1749402 [Mycena galericulata]|nr:hypothetical protein B0H11DRAFT_1749402 [Mycena galericulata]
MLPSALPPSAEGNVKLQGLALSDDGTSLTGVVTVSKLAFHKWVTVQFSFDDWQTTSEVRARWTITGVFTFSVRLTDFPTTKVMALVVKYDNDNYPVTLGRAGET